ncbi:MAG TPA: zinc-binding dehydrogenase [Steroidobacteraceae bacterium]|nr:zinc-binding dehydrogenase [Steroidobacteraceae bacterium]
MRADAVFDTVGEATWAHSLEAVRRGGVIVIAGRTSGSDPPANLRQIMLKQVTVSGSVLGTLEQMRDLIRFVVETGIEPQVGKVLPLSQAERGFREMAQERTFGKTIFTLDT